MRILALPAFKNRRENPYNAALYTALEQIPGVTVTEFTNRRLLLQRWDILHIHWPDTPLHRLTAAGAAIYTALLVLRVIWAKLLGAKIVWTVHNLRSHHGAWPGVEKWLWRCFVPLVDGCIHLSQSGKEMALEAFPGLASKSHSVVRHGHYRGCYPNDCDREQSRLLLGIRTTGPIIAFVGQIKAYKNVGALIRAFIDAADPRATLLIAGRPGNAEMEADLRALARNRSRVVCHLGLIPDDRMHCYLNACDLTVFPYRDILNSGSAILSLSFNRPTLVPERGAMAELRHLAGSDWVYTYEGGLTGAVLSDALKKAVSGVRGSECDLSALSWESIATDTLAAYRAARGQDVAEAGEQSALIQMAPQASECQ
jgi:glycosyltransferase involved in cell wall biosynthesis